MGILVGGDKMMEGQNDGGGERIGWLVSGMEGSCRVGYVKNGPDWSRTAVHDAIARYGAVIQIELVGKSERIGECCET